jgi:universal stress protein E
MIWRRLMLATASVDSIPTHVLDRVGRIARGLHAEVELFHSVYEPDKVQPRLHAQPVDQVIAREVEDRHRRLERFADELREQKLTVRTTVRWDFPMHEGVIRQAARHKVDLVVLPAVYTTGIARRTLTFREMSLIESCPCPLLILKSPEVYSRGAVVAAVDPGHAHGKPEDLDEVILGAANTISRAMSNIGVHVYHAVAPAGTGTPGDDADSAGVAGAPVGAAGSGAGGSSAGEQPGEGGARFEAMESQVRELASRHDVSSVRVERARVEQSLPSFVRQVRADILVMGAVSRTFPQRALFGHTAERVLDEVACDVLVVKPRGFRSPVEVEPSPAIPRPF